MAWGVVVTLLTKLWLSSTNRLVITNPIDIQMVKWYWFHGISTYLLPLLVSLTLVYPPYPARLTVSVVTFATASINITNT